MWYKYWWYVVSSSGSSVENPIGIPVSWFLNKYSWIFMCLSAEAWAIWHVKFCSFTLSGATSSQASSSSSRLEDEELCEASNSGTFSILIGIYGLKRVILLWSEIFFSVRVKVLVYRSWPNFSFWFIASVARGFTVFFDIRAAALGSSKVFAELSFRMSDPNVFIFLNRG